MGVATALTESKNTAMTLMDTKLSMLVIQHLALMSCTSSWHSFSSDFFDGDGSLSLAFHAPCFISASNNYGLQIISVKSQLNQHLFSDSERNFKRSDFLSD